MWLSGSTSAACPSNLNGQSSTSYTQLEAKLYQDLYNEVRAAPPLGTLSYSLRSRLNRLSNETSVRRNLVSRVHKDNGCSPLFIACKKGNVEIVEYLVSQCDADVEQKGLYEVTDDHSVHHVSPLWCARYV